MISNDCNNNMDNNKKKYLTGQVKKINNNKAQNGLKKITVSAGSRTNLYNSTYHFVTN